MSLVFKDSQIAVISPGSDATFIQCGLGDSLILPVSFVSTKVYRKDGKYTFQKTDEEVIPMKEGAITDEKAFHYFLRQIYHTMSQQMGVAPALLVLKSPQWSKRQVERLSQHLFEEAGVPGLVFLPTALANSYAFAAKDCIVIDVGKDKTDVTVVHEFEAPSHFHCTIPFGGNEINKSLEKAFHLDADVTEDLKLSGIVELPVGYHEAPDVEAEEGVVDVAAIVSSGRTREFLEQREREQKGDSEVPKSNGELQENSFTDRHGNTHTVGPDRFTACDSLIREISKVVGLVINRVLPRARSVIWQNIIVTGRGSQLNGFKQGLLSQLEKIYLVSNSSISTTTQQFSTPDPGKQTPNEGDAPGQAPNSIKLVQIADHFPEWKSSGCSQSGFLGAQIAAKQSFSGQATFFVSRTDYNEIGPSAIWDM